MRADVAASRALVFGGTGAVGRAVLRGLAKAGVPTVFTYHRSADAARALAEAHAQRAIAIDLAEPSAVRHLIQELDRAGELPNLFIHAAAVSQPSELAQITEQDWDRAQRVNVQAPFVAIQELSARLTQGGHMVLVGALGAGQSLPAPVHFAATQGALSAMAMSLGKELGPRGIRTNLVALGLLEAGLSREIAPELSRDYKNFSALRRLGKPEEAARAILWLALENTYMNGEVLPVNGGL